MISIYKKTISDNSLVKVNRVETGAWVNLTNPTNEELNDIAEKTKTHKDFLKSALDPDEKPRIEIENGSVLLIIRVPCLDIEDKIVTLPLSIVFSEKNVITCSIKENDILTDFTQLKVKNFFTTKKTRFALQILKSTNNYYEKYLDIIEKTIEDVEKTLLKSLKNEEIVKLLSIQKSLVYLNTAIVSNEKVLEKVLNGKVLQLYKEDEDLLEDIIIDNKQSIDMVNIYNNILANTMDAYASLVSNNLNIVMKFLASITIILAIPAIVSSFYGMNLNLPLQANSHAFWFILFISIIFSFVASLVFLKKNYF